MNWIPRCRIEPRDRPLHRGVEAQDKGMIICGDARAIPLADRSVQCVVTSPPYWGLRDYGTATWEGGDPACDHRIGRVMGNANKGHVRDVLDGDRSRCACGATRIDQQLGLEPTPDAYVASLVAVFREVRRVLRDDGTFWLNIGDSYTSGGRTWRATDKKNPIRAMDIRSPTPPGLKPKDLVGIPWRVAFALQADGWYLRSDIIWAKPNPMPESVTDRPTKAHEYVFLLTKSARYYYDAEAVKESANPKNYRANAATIRDTPPGQTKQGKLDDRRGEVYCDTRNARSVWTITTKPFKGAHFATFPPELVTPCVRAGTPEGGCCAACGAPRKRIIEKGAPDLLHRKACGGTGQLGLYDGVATKDFTRAAAQDASATKARILAGMVERRTTGWGSTCACDASVVPATVFDPFSGSGTTVKVAQDLGRRGIGLDLNPAYATLARARLAGKARA